MAKYIDIEWQLRMSPSTTMMNDDKLICCGGDNYETDADIFDFATKKITKLANMNNDRELAGICIDDYIHNNVYVGGGERSGNTFEYYDIIKNKWICLCNTAHYHEYWPIILNYDPNTINNYWFCL